MYAELQQLRRKVSRLEETLIRQQHSSDNKLMDVFTRLDNQYTSIRRDLNNISVWLPRQRRIARLELEQQNRARNE
eukprot:Pgem_evm1s2070